ncbi:MAG: hypothetical protein ACOC0N_03140 [Chroococcales cyanobacterium]
MSSQLFLVQSVLAQTSATEQPGTSSDGKFDPASLWMYSTIALLLVVGGLVVYGKQQLNKAAKELRFEQFKTKELNKKLKLALKTIQKMEKNPDLVHSREFNLDYLRMRMDEEVFHYAIVNQIKVRIKDLITTALRPNTGTNTSVGIANSSGRQIEETFDVMYDTQSKAGKRMRGVLFRIQIKLMKLPTQSTSATVSEIIQCLEKYLSPTAEDEHWQPTIQGRIVRLDWDQKAKPTPMLVLEQLGDGVNVSFRTTPTRRAAIN